MSMMTAYYIDTMAKDHWQQMRAGSVSRKQEPENEYKLARRLRLAFAALVLLAVTLVAVL